MDRSKQIVRTSIVGIGVNLVLVAFKMAVGLIANSIAIILDAVNNLSDALSSIITIVGTKLAGRKPDKKHPYGYGRIEYLTGMLIAVIVLFAGVTSLKESVEKIFRPEEASYSVPMLVIIAAAIVAKLLVGRYVKGVGEKISSQALVASGSDALFDAVLSLGTLVAALAGLIWGLKLEGILGAIISLFIIKAGIEMLMETLNSITGERADPELTVPLREAVCAYPGVRGAYDLTLHSYGPTSTIGSIHIEVDDDMTARELHKLTRHISADIYQKFGVILTVGVYSASDSDEKWAEARQKVEEAVARHPEILQMHGFYLDEEVRQMMFDVVIDFAADEQQVVAQLRQELRESVPEYEANIVLDSDFSD